MKEYKLKDVSVAVVDDHEVVLEGLRSFLLKNSITEVEAYRQAHALLDRIATKHFDVYLIDVELTDMNVTELIREIRNLHLEARIIINTIHEETWVVNKLTEMKVDAVVYKSGQLDQLLDAISAVIDGKKYFCRNFKKTQNNIQILNDIPSSRELDILKLIAMGHSTREISSSLFISENTVENHRKSLFRKLQAHNTVDRIMKAIAAGYVDPEEITNRS